eukprot:NODE_26935_length_532_cov_1.674074.p1 GENE.NODE_26935_length_532_cov_1.674074~~NODE_26935_length_532_cov_1.674074.p1  ORF type:complete len:86 (-),score=7.83 NODE_26935_length_532_cov_1.674074:65-322(-)
MMSRVRNKLHNPWSGEASPMASLPTQGVTARTEHKRNLVERDAHALPHPTSSVSSIPQARVPTNSHTNLAQKDVYGAQHAGTSQE